MPRPALDETFVLVVDDWNHPPAREGAMAAIAATRLEILFSITLRTTTDGSRPLIHSERSDWHTIYVCFRRQLGVLTSLTLAICSAIATSPCGFRSPSSFRRSVACVSSPI